MTGMGFSSFTSMEDRQTNLVPEQHSGTTIDTESKTEFETIEEAKAFYRIARQLLLNVNEWKETAANFSADFQLIDEAGKEINGDPRTGCFFRISIPGPGNKDGEGYDWVRIEAVDETEKEESDITSIRVRPTDYPFNNEEQVAHFYSRDTTSTFTVAREGRTVIAGVYDRNTKPNTEPGNLVTKLRDAVVGTAAVLLFSKLQWKSLTDGLVKPGGDKG